MVIKALLVVFDKKIQALHLAVEAPHSLIQVFERMNPRLEAMIQGCVASASSQTLFTRELPRAQFAGFFVVFARSKPQSRNVKKHQENGVLPDDDLMIRI